jgi:hypothetical protein
MITNVFIGGMVAGAFDESGKYLLAVSHAGRGVFETSTWERVARDTELAYPKKGLAVGIGPLAGVTLKVHEIDYATGVLEFTSPDGAWLLHYTEGTLTISSAHATPSPSNA